MPKPVFGLILGAILGAIDGASSYLYPYPEVRSLIGEIILYSSIKSLVVGAILGFFASKVKSIPWGVVLGLALGLFFAYLAASQPSTSGEHYYIEIMTPGAVVGAILGYATQKYNRETKVA